MIIFEGKYTNAKVMIDQIDESCSSQITQFINHPAFTNPVSIMPDTHAGAGSVIGFTMEMSDKIIPNTVGVDIGCSMVSINIGKNPYGLVGEEYLLGKELVDRKIREVIPFGYNVNAKIAHNPEAMNWSKLQVLAGNFAWAFNNKFGTNIQPPEYNLDWYKQNCRAIGVDFDRVARSIGSLGGGNHFIEIGKSAVTDDYWLTVHSGSRNYGKRVCDHWQLIAKKKIQEKRGINYENKLNEVRNKYKGEDIKRKIEEIKLEAGLSGRVDKGLEYLEGDDMVGYLFNMLFAQHYAYINTSIIANTIVGTVFKCQANDVVECVHNYIDFNDLIIRKGAISSYKDARIIIPFNMRAGLLICKGKENPEWNYSAPHGAGRVFSRSQAKKEIKLEAVQKQMEGIFSTSVTESTLDEAPDAYKDPSVIEEAISPTAEIVDRIIPVHSLKDGGEHQRRGKRR